MHFISTRGNKEKVIASKAIIKGICDDGGLYVPTYFPNLKDKLNNLVNLSYKELCFEANRGDDAYNALVEYLETHPQFVKEFSIMINKYLSKVITLTL